MADNDGDAVFGLPGPRAQRQSVPGVPVALDMYGNVLPWARDGVDEEEEEEEDIEADVIDFKTRTDEELARVAVAMSPEGAPAGANAAAAAAGPQATATAPTALETSLGRRSSSRVLAMQKRTAEAAAFVRAARAKLDEEERAAAAASAARAAAAPGYRPIRSVIDTMTDEQYLAASESIVPVFLGGVATDNQLIEPVGPDLAPRITFNQLFGERTAEVCERIYGKILTARLQTLFSPIKDIRDFFEIVPARKQCPAVLGGMGGTIKTHCWICGFELQLPPCEEGICQQDCEHRADLLLAMVTTGIYDTVLHKILLKANRAKEYIDLLRYEYAYAHPGCNRLKKDTHFFTATVVGQGEAKYAKFEASLPDITATLTAIFGKDAWGFKGPTIGAIKAKITTAPQWDGKLESPTAAIPPANSQDDYLKARPGVIASALKSLIDKLNMQALTPREVCARITRGFLLRAIMIAPEVTKETIWNTLPETYKQILNRRLGVTGGRRRRTPRRKRTRKQMRGGVNPQEEDAYKRVLGWVAEYIVCSLYLPDLVLDLLTIDPVDPYATMKMMETVADKHVAMVHGHLQRIRLDILYSLATSPEFQLKDGETGKVIVGYLVETIFAGVWDEQPTAVARKRKAEAGPSPKRVKSAAASASGPPEDKGSNEPARAAAASASASPAAAAPAYGSLTVMTSAAPAPGFVTPTGKGSRSGSESMRTEELSSAQREAGTPSTSGPGSPIALAAALAAAAAEKPAAANGSQETAVGSFGPGTGSFGSSQQYGGLRLGRRPDWL